MIEVLYARYGARYLHEVETTEAAFGYIEAGEDAGEISAIGVFIDGEPVVWDGYKETTTPDEEQRQIMIAEYKRAKEQEVRNERYNRRQDRG